jgi:hypothetical protein
MTKEIHESQNYEPDLDNQLYKEGEYRDLITASFGHLQYRKDSLRS